MLLIILCVHLILDQALFILNIIGLFNNRSKEVGIIGLLASGFFAHFDETVVDAEVIEHFQHQVIVGILFVPFDAHVWKMDGHQGVDLG